MKGVIYTLEAAIIFVIVLFSVFLVIPSIRQPGVRLNSVYECLNKNKESVEFYARYENSNAIKSSLSECMPKNFDFDILVCSSLPCSREIIKESVYVIDNLSGERLVRMWVWEK